MRPYAGFRPFTAERDASDGPNVCGTRVSGLSPLKGMPLTDLDCASTHVSNLSPLEGMKLWNLHFEPTPVSDLSPLKGMPLTELRCNNTRVSDLSPLEGMNLTRMFFTPRNITKGLDVIRRMKSLKTLGPSCDKQFPPDEFWKRWDAGKSSK